MRNTGDVASAVGKGLFAGAAGTVLMTISSTIEAKLRDRAPSSAPADAAGKVLGVQPRDQDGQARFSNAVHWAYGTGWGAVRGLIALTDPESAGRCRNSLGRGLGFLARDAAGARCGAATLEAAALRGRR